MLNILIVDDENMSRMTMESIFSAYGTCKSFSTGKMAAQAFMNFLETKQRFGLIILDISLEKESGVDVLKLIRSSEKKSGISDKNRAVIFMATGNSDMRMVKKCIQEGCNDYLVKPVKTTVVTTKTEKYNFELLE